MKKRHIQKNVIRSICMLLSLCFFMNMLVFTASATTQTFDQSVVIDAITVKARDVQVNGRIFNSKGRTLGGQKLTMIVGNASLELGNISPENVKNQINLVADQIYTGVSNSDGTFSIPFKVSSKIAGGLFTVFVGGTLISQPVKKQFYFLQPDLEPTVLGAFYNTHSTNDVLNTFDLTANWSEKTISYKELLALDFSQGFNQLSGEDQQVVLGKFIQKRFTKAEEIRQLFSDAIILMNLKNAQTVGAVRAILEAQSQSLSLDFTGPYEKIQNFDAVYGKLYQKTFNTGEEIRLAFQNAVIEQFMQEQYIAKPVVTVSSGEMNVGQSVSVSVSFNALTAFRGFDLQVQFQNNIFSIRKEDIQFEKVISQANPNPVVTMESGVLGLSKEGIVSVADIAATKLCSFKAVPLAGSAGTQTIHISGVVKVFNAVTNSIISLPIDGRDGSFLVREGTSRDGTGSGGGSGGNMVVTATPSPSQTPTPVPSVSPSATPKTEVNVGSFNDLSNVPWAEESINYLTQKGIVNGIQDQDGVYKFMPNQSVTRAQFIKMLVIALNLGDQKATVNFSDVSRDAWYYVPIASAYQLGITKGISESEFGVSKEITRQEMAVMAARAIEAAKILLPFEKKTAFLDEDEIAPYAVGSVILMQGAGIISGTENNQFAPIQTSTRAMAAKIIYGLLARQNGDSKGAEK